MQSCISEVAVAHLRRSRLYCLLKALCSSSLGRLDSRLDRCRTCSAVQLCPAVQAGSPVLTSLSLARPLRVLRAPYGDPAVLTLGLKRTSRGAAV